MFAKIFEKEINLKLFWLWLINFCIYLYTQVLETCSTKHKNMLILIIVETKKYYIKLVIKEILSIINFKKVSSCTATNNIIMQRRCKVSSFLIKLNFKDMKKKIHLYKNSKINFILN